MIAKEFYYFDKIFSINQFRVSTRDVETQLYTLR